MLKKYLKSKKGFLESLILVAFIVLLSFQSSADEPKQLALNDYGDSFIKEKQVVEVNESLKNVIEENQILLDQKNQLEFEVQKLKKENMDHKKTKQELAEDLEKTRNVNRQYSKELSNLESQLSGMTDKNKEISRKTDRLEQELKVQSSWDKQDEVLFLASVQNEDVVDRESKTVDILSKIDSFTEQDERLKLDSARAHYNMGNIYFQKGDYEIAVREYYQAVTLMPDDPDSHYNLAFVSGEYLGDQKTALKHYQMYLYLKPGAKDTPFVKEK
ncbi:MAG: tetratricopeptide repeat protein, partial [Candidatus Omnitrophica bacterium]|nr:tetratricopeptide repeat protein [Candidatus Omnitrophota bacterium]